MKKENNISDIIVFLLSVLFVYASLSKLLMVHGFMEQLEQSLLIPRKLISAIAYGVPVFELLIVGLLFLNKTRLIGFYSSFFLMAGFTIYLIMLLSIDETLPCSCGGILGEMGFKTHVGFNLFFCAISLWGIRIENRKLKKYYA